MPFAESGLSHPRKPQMILTEEQTKAFHDKGVIVLKGFFGKEMMDKVSTRLDELRDKQPGRNQEAKYFEKSTITGQSILVRV